MKRCPSCRRRFTADRLLPTLRPRDYCAPPIDPEALGLCPDCEDRELFPEIVPPRRQS